MTSLADVFDPDLLDYCVRERMVVARRHPQRDLTILNYTERCQYERGLWNPVTLQCRGLIHDDDGNVVARPFSKFFNYGDDNAGALSPELRVSVTDKLDGSLGILYDGDSIATRGSFDSEQAQWATDWLRREQPQFQPPTGWTVLFEIIYPANRIVVDYDERAELVLLGAVEIATGQSIGPDRPSFPDWRGAFTDTFPAQTLADALAIPPRPNAEGIVIHILDDNRRIKVKQKDYVALHRIVTGLNERTVWAHLKDGNPVEVLLDNLPDEFHEWVREVAERLGSAVAAGSAEVESAYSAIIATLPPDYSRKDFALIAKEHPRQAELFAKLSGKDYSHILWEQCYPAPHIGPRGLTPSEESA